MPFGNIEVNISRNNWKNKLLRITTESVEYKITLMLYFLDYVDKYLSTWYKRDYQERENEDDV